MSNVIKFNNRSKEYEEKCERACAWLSRLDAGASAEDKDRFCLWLEEDPENSDIFFEMAALWDQMAMLSELSDIFPLKQYIPSTSNNGYLTHKGLMVGASAMLLVLIITTVLIFFDQNNLQSMNMNEMQELSIITYETRIGEQSTVSLPDGSEVLLNTNTLLEVSYSDDTRIIFLDRGEALFTVAKDVDRPFRVYAGSQVIEAVGTVFSVQRSGQNNLEVMVTEGKVNYLLVNTSAEDISSDSRSIISDSLENVMSMVAGEYATTDSAVPEQIQKIFMPQDEIEVQMAWQHGMLLFQGDALSRVLEEVSRYTTIRIEAEDEIKDIQVEGYFRAGDIEGLLIAMQNNFQITGNRMDDDYILFTAQ